MSALPNPDDLVLKLILVGDSGVGKSCLLKAFMGDPFKGVYTSTIGVDFEIKPLTLHGRTINLQIWDTAGQERFRTITTSYYRSADAIMLVFDLTDEQSFANVELWMEDVRLYSQRHVEVVLIGNKCDLAEDRRLDYKDAKGQRSTQPSTQPPRPTAPTSRRRLLTRSPPCLLMVKCAVCVHPCARPVRCSGSSLQALQWLCAAPSHPTALCRCPVLRRRTRTRIGSCTSRRRPRAGSTWRRPSHA